MMNSNTLRPSAHALETMTRRDVSWSEVIEACEHPTIAEPPYQGRRRFHRGTLCVVVAEDGTVVTVLLRGAHQWDDEQARQRPRG